MTTTIESLTGQQINTLRREALAADDIAMAAICDIASNPAEFDIEAYPALGNRDTQRIQAMDQAAAYAAVVEAINHAEAQ